MSNSTTKISSMYRSNLFKGKVAIVTGGGTGIGKAITQELLYLGCKVMIASRNLERLSASALEMRKDISNSSAELEYMQCNIRKEEQVKELIKTTLSRFGKLDYLVNNGGGQFVSPSSQIRLKGWNAVVETNLTGTFLCCREAYSQWMEENGGAVVNIIIGLAKGTPTISHSGAARAGVENLTKSLAIEWAHSGFRINCVAPGLIYNETAAQAYGDRKVFDDQLPYVPARRSGTVEEVSAAVCFLLSPAASFISGDTLYVDGAAKLYKSIYTIPDHDKSQAYKWDEDSPVGEMKSKL